VVKSTKGEHLNRLTSLLRHVRESTLLQLLKGNQYVVNYEAHCINVETGEFALITPFYRRGNLKLFVEAGKLVDLTIDQLLD